jgi:hypothetical protein
MQQGEDAPFEDNRWTEELTALDRFVFDLFCGLDNARFGYERDRFTVTEMAAFWSELSQSAASDKSLAQMLARAEVDQFDSVLANGGWSRLRVRARREAGAAGLWIIRSLRRTTPMFYARPWFHLRCGPGALRHGHDDGEPAHIAAAGAGSVTEH